MRKQWWAVALLGATLFACGGGGGPASVAGPEPEQEQLINLGLVRGDAPTMVPLLFTKPFKEPGTVELLEAPAGAVTPLEGALPMSLDAGDRSILWATFTPPSAPENPTQGTIRLVFRRDIGDARFPVTLKVDAEIEKPSVRLVETGLQLGNVPLGERLAFSVRFENASLVTPVALSDVTLSPGDCSLAPDAPSFPIAVAPRSTLLLPLVYAPRTETAASSLLRVFHTAAPEPLEATLEGRGIAARVVLDFGVVPLDPATGESEWLYVDVAPEGVGILIEAFGDPLSVIDLAGFEGPSGRIYEAGGLLGPLGWLSGYPAGGLGFLNVELPDSARPEVQLAPGGGTYRFRVRDAGCQDPGPTVRATVTQRRLGEATQGTLHVQVFLADGLPLADRSDPMRDAKLLAALKTLDAILGEHGIRLGEITFMFMDPPFDVVTDEGAEAQILAYSGAPPEDARLNLFLVKSIGEGVAGFAGASPGPSLDGWRYSGVVVEYGSSSGIVLGARAAHVVAHYLGSFGMTLFPQPDAAHPMLRHPLVSPGLPETLLAPPGTYQQAQVMAASEPSPGTWCGTCSHAPVR